ncbi:hypothetical protein AB0B60_43985 [Streptomyces lincolnensis]|uniref:hypothetical protein n=1 Tax=Streptomyces lincolnensis TaxID=1915 RepID=UPI00135208BA|nr:hypothetical protein [Streptomyces lincolnensis]
MPLIHAGREPEASEALVNLLTLRLRETARAGDGSGGYGGRDRWEETHSGELDQVRGSIRAVEPAAWV